jgi:hypothetical protein
MCAQTAPRHDNPIRIEHEQKGGPGVLGRLEDDLLKISGVMSARVIGDDSPTEIHIVATADRSPKQVVRDVQSLATARHGVTIDHRIVSIVQLGENEIPSRPPEVEEIRRPHLDRVVFANKGTTGWVKVELRWPDGESTEGAGIAGASRESRARGAATAVQHAIRDRLAKKDAMVEVDQVVVQNLGANVSVTVGVVLHERGSSTPLVGSALIHDDVATAAVHAALHAVNRKLT